MSGTTDDVREAILLAVGRYGHIAAGGGDLNETLDEINATLDALVARAREEGAREAWATASRILDQEGRAADSTPAWLVLQRLTKDFRERAQVAS
jgi:hypothetical protein